MTEDKHSAELNERLEAEMMERHEQFERYKEQRKWQGVMGREELIALCAAHILAESFASKLGLAASDNAWNAVRMAAEIVDYSFTYDDLKHYEGIKQAEKQLEKWRKAHEKKGGQHK